jgi:REP element-mobilizing transposase RayT
MNHTEMSQISLFKKRKRTRVAGKLVKLGRPVTTHTGARERRVAFRRSRVVHLTLRLREGLPNLRTRKGAQIVKRAILGAQSRGLRVIHFSILSNHIHLICEALSLSVLMNSMKSLTSRMGIHLRRLIKEQKHHSNRLEVLDKEGLGLFRGRYNLQAIQNPAQMKQTLAYVLLNPAKHFKKAPYLDAFTSAAIFEDWQKLIGRELNLNSSLATLKKNLKEFLAPPQLWLTQAGWAKARLRLRSDFS